MSTFPEPVPDSPDDTPNIEGAEPSASEELEKESLPSTHGEGTVNTEAPSLSSGIDLSAITPSLSPQQDFSQPLIAPFAALQPPKSPQERIPNAGHLGILGLLVLFGLVGAWMLSMGALKLHLWGVTKLSQAANDFHYSMFSQAAWYLITFTGCMVVFPLIWRKSFFQGIHWEGAVAAHRFWPLVGAAIVCFFVAMINSVLMPGPENAPIDQLFKAPGAAWILFAFGVTLAPFFEEMAFRGFLLPSLCTAWDWGSEQVTGTPRRPLDENGNPNWSLTAMVVGSVITSIPFALMHGAQTAWSLGPFLLLVFVSLVLCWVRLSTRSLAASTVVHASYNFMLFSFMLLGTGGFKHLDKM